MAGEVTIKRLHDKRDVKHILLNFHYAERVPSISFAFGGYASGKLVGVVTYGSPIGSTVHSGLFRGGDVRVLELNRLCLLTNRKNHASQVIAHSLKLLPPCAVISYADPAQGHEGYVYRATNALYLGLTAKRTDWALHSEPHVHGKTISDRFKGHDAPAKAARDKYGDDFYLRPRSRKHRYLYLVGNKRDRREMLAKLKARPQGYPR